MFLMVVDVSDIVVMLLQIGLNINKLILISKSNAPIQNKILTFLKTLKSKLAVIEISII
jgi:hypothetical protein|tara:strand:+ start:4278 stop:4454 length:177 start_codon:yes stop_codon:yes gene_type:complete